MSLLKIEKVSKIKGAAHKRGGIRTFLLGMGLVGIVLGVLKYEIHRIEIEVIKPAFAENHAEKNINCILKIDPLYEAALEN